MPAYRDHRTGRWRYRKLVEFPDGTRQRVSGTPSRDTKRAAEEAEREAIDRALREHRERALGVAIPRKEQVPTFKDWFDGRFWREWVVARKNKPSESESKRSIFKIHLEPAFGAMRLTEVDAGAIARFRADLVDSGRSDKTINNVLAVLSKALKYAEDVRLIDRAPKVGLLRVERPEIVAWGFEEYARVIEAARELEPMWYVAACLAGEAGLRIGEVRALDWRRDVDLVAATITVNQQTRRGKTGTPKGRTRRTVPMTDTLAQALRSLHQVRTGFVVCNPDGTAMTDDQTKYHCYRICRRAGLPERGWHTLRHSFGTHAAMFGVNPWKLMQWMGHKRVDETMLYVHLAEAHLRPLPQEILDAQRGPADPDRRIVAMLGARRAIRGNHVATAQASPERSAGLSLR